MPPFPLHPQRDRLVGELHARPLAPLATPATLSRLAMLVAPGADRAADIAHLAALCRLYGVNEPAAEAIHFTADFGAFQLRYERHTEFTGWTFLKPLPTPPAGQDPFDDTAIDALPRDWLAALPGQAIAAFHIALIPEPADEEPRFAGLPAEGLVASTLAGGAGLVGTDFRIHPDGFARFLVLDGGLGAARAGRIAQTLWEIETYRMMALLALPIARGAAPQLSEASERLSALASRARGSGGLEHDRAALAELSDLATGIETMAATTAERFSAAEAYRTLVAQRLDALAEVPIPGLPTLREFLGRRLDPAIATVAATGTRIARLSVRCARAVDLLRARVAVAQEAQTQTLLAAMAETGRAQLRLQETVEGLSVAGISYYLVSLASYTLKPLQSTQPHLPVEGALSLMVPLVAAAVWLWMRRRQRRSAV
ncbi:DUF3422 family protein [Plastoroseomonas arctica]|uniref:DUF3422 domain-containing protein n=1 Tax=Plastoroseomonas arctica TaxID=1509237 RepID=A0AAF1KPC8_9PROT|nr:DUF3422 domain-containing protein [Plastoroseomonas arctica]MBR0657329.1 DUF3422 domain-containing protein [Plastoroseomonas arctica]